MLFNPLFISFCKVGFDMDSYEDFGNSLSYYADLLIDFKEENPEMQYFFHAGTIKKLKVEQ